MTKVLYCREIGWDCPFKATGPTPELVVREMEEHVAQAHKVKASFTRLAGWYAAVQTADEDVQWPEEAAGKVA